MLLFITTILITGIMFLEKIYFFNNEKIYATSFWGIIEMSTFFITFCLGIVFFLKQYSKKFRLLTKHKDSKDNKVFNKFNLLVLFFIIATLFFVVSSFYLNYTKTSIHWDAVALYDARAKFLQHGMKFSEMPILAKYDNLNQYYYLLYPPYTSIAHFFWRIIPLVNLIPVSVYYSVVLLFLTAVVYLVGKERFGLLIAVLIAFITASNSSIFNVVIKEYTNLPFNLYLVGGILLLYSYIGKPSTWKYLFGVVFVASSLWIRLLEPIWLGIIIAFAISTFSRKETIKSSLRILFLLAFCLIEYLSWSYFTSTIAHNPGFLNITKLSIIDTFIGGLTGAPFVVFFTIVRSWGIPFLIHASALIGSILRIGYIKKNPQLKFLAFVVFISIGIYFTEFYALSFQEDWWSIVAMSLDRSSTFLIPISAFVLFELVIPDKFKQS